MQVEFTIRKHKPEDFLALWWIDQSCFAPEIAYSQEELKRYLNWRNSFTLVAENSGVNQEPKVADEETDFHGIIGFVVADRVRTTGHIITIDVRAAARGQGVGSALLETAEAQLNSSGCRTVRLETAVDNLAALDFYKKHGYSVVRTAPRYYSNGLDALVFEKDLLSQLPSDNVQK
jgi:[ribosomal protein S18]-alanine N-acetyltransferase